MTCKITDSKVLLSNQKKSNFLIVKRSCDAPLLLASAVKAKFHYTIQVADLRVHVVRMSQAGPQLVESQLRTGLRPGSSHLEVRDQVCDLDSVMEFSVTQVADRFDLSRQARFELVASSARELDSAMEFGLN